MEFEDKRTGGYLHAVDDVSLTVAEGETLALVGESGCGKTTLTRVILQLLAPTGGTVIFEGMDLTTAARAALRAKRRDLQVILQDPYASLNPRMRVSDIILEPLYTHGLLRRGRRHRAQAEAKITELLTAVGLDPAVRTRYPHEFSGGQRQRIGIARALALEPRLILCDEPVSALDVSVQAQILELLKQLQRTRRLSYVFVSHDMAVVRHIADRVAVMYLGAIVESGPVEQIFSSPKHPYTQALLSAVPRTGGDAEGGRVVLAGDPPSPVNPPSGCRFRTRCPLAREECAQERPPLIPQGSPEHLAACFFPVDTIAELARAQLARK